MQDTPDNEQEQVKVDTNWLTKSEFSDSNMNHRMLPEDLGFMQGLVQKRMANPDFLKFFENLDINNPDQKQQMILAVYCHTCFEMGVEKGLNDLEHMIKEMMEATVGDKNGPVDTNETTRQSNSSSEESSGLRPDSKISD